MSIGTGAWVVGALCLAGFVGLVVGWDRRFPPGTRDQRGRARARPAFALGIWTAGTGLLACALLLVADEPPARTDVLASVTRAAAVITVSVVFGWLFGRAGERRRQREEGP